MKTSPRFAMSCGFVAALLAVSFPASAESGSSGDHPGGASTTLDVHSQNIKLLGNSPGRTVLVDGEEMPITNSDLAFDGNLLYAGDFNGFRILDISAPARPRVLSEFDCTGGQGDVSVYRGLLFRSVDAPRSGPACDAARGVDIILLSDKARAGAVKLGLNNPQTQEFLIN